MCLGFTGFLRVKCLGCRLYGVYKGPQNVLNL